VSILRRKRCADCRAPVPDPASDRCGGCHELYQAELDGLQGAYLPRGDHQPASAAGEVVVDYSRGGDALPGLRPVAHYRSNPRHDGVTRARLEQEEAEKPGGGTEPNWAEMTAQAAAREASGHWARFPAPPMHSSAPDPLGRSAPRDRGVRDNGMPYELVNPAAEGVAYVRSPAAGRRAMQAAKASRFGPNVPMAAPVQSGQLAAPPTAMVEQEAAQAEAVRTASEHLRSLGPSASLRR
jgi:hypothetical protein